MSSLEIILILVILLNFAPDSVHSLQDDDESLSDLEDNLLSQDELAELLNTTLLTENETESSSLFLSSIEEFCSEDVMDSIGLVYHVGSHLLLSVTQKPNELMEFFGYLTNDTVKQWFYVYNWKTGYLYHRMVELNKIFVMPDVLKPGGPLLFATSLFVNVQPSTEELVLATFATSTASLENHACHDFPYLDLSLTSNQFLSTRMFRLANSVNESVFIPKLSLYPTVLELIQLRGSIGFGFGGILIRDELACPRVSGTANSTAVQYASGFTLSDKLILQAKPGFVQIGPIGTEIPISKLLNCPSSWSGPNSYSSVFSNELKLVPVPTSTTTNSTNSNQNPQLGFLFFQVLETLNEMTFGQYPYIFWPISVFGWMSWIIPCCMRIGEEIYDDYTENNYKPYPEEQPEQIQYV